MCVCVSAADKFHLLKTAFEFLNDSAKRAEYDSKLKAQFERQQKLAKEGEQFRALRQGECVGGHYHFMTIRR